MDVLTFPFWKRFTAEELRAMQTLAKGQADDLKIDDGRTRVWICRSGVHDGMPYDNAITVERFDGQRWSLTETYKG